MTNRLKYNVGAMKIGDTYKQIFSGSSDGTPFLAMRLTGLNTASTPATVSVVKYLPVDYIRSMMVLGLCVLDARVNLADYENAKAPLYTTAPTSATIAGLREISISNLNDGLTENYIGAPYFSLAGEGIEEYTATAAEVIAGTAVPTYVYTNSNAGAMAATGIGIVDDTWTFIKNNLVLVAAVVGAFIYFDPLDLFKKKKKGKR